MNKFFEFCFKKDFEFVKVSSQIGMPISKKYTYMYVMNICYKAWSIYW